MRHVPVARDGWRFIVPSAFIGAVLVALKFGWSIVGGAVVLVFSAFCFYFFRDFDRVTPTDENLIYSPGDGKVVGVELESEGEWKGFHVVRIFLSVLDGHVQRAPVSGKVESIRYKKGNFLDARNPEAHIHNEQNVVVLATPKGPVIVKQIAGLIARRIVCRIKQGENVEQGSRYGLIRFGSQVDVLFPAADVVVQPGERVVGGKSILARWASK